MDCEKGATKQPLRVQTPPLGGCWCRTNSERLWLQKDTHCGDWIVAVNPPGSSCHPDGMLGVKRCAMESVWPLELQDAVVFLDRLSWFHGRASDDVFTILSRGPIWHLENGKTHGGWFHLGYSRNCLGGVTCKSLDSIRSHKQKAPSMQVSFQRTEAGSPNRHDSCHKLLLVRSS